MLKNNYRMTLLIAVLTLGSIIVCPGAQADRQDRGRWWLTPSIQQQLQLSETEIQTLDSAYDVTYSRMIELRGDKKVAQIRLAELLKNPEFDKGAILKEYKNMQTTRNALTDERFAFFLETRKILGHDRFVQLLEIKEAQRHRHHERKPESTQ